METRPSLQNQSKQQGVLQNLVLDLKPSNENQQDSAKKETELNNECKICMERPLATALTPCGHTVCFQCAKKLKFKDCPTCRVKISGLQKIFLNWFHIVHNYIEINKEFYPNVSKDYGSLMHCICYWRAIFWNLRNKRVVLIHVDFGPIPFMMW